MSAWAKTAAEYWRHPKVQCAIGMPRGLEAVGLSHLALAWAVDTLSDGVLPRGQIIRLTGLPDAHELAEVLVTAGLWETTPTGGYRIHDFLDYNWSRERALADKAARQESASAAGTVRATHASRDGGGRFTSGHAGNGAGRDAGNGTSPVLSSSQSPEPSDSQGDTRADPLDEVLVWMAQHRVSVAPGSRTHTALVQAVDRNGAAKCIEAAETYHTRFPDDRAGPQVVFGMVKILEPIRDTRSASTPSKGATGSGDLERAVERV